MLIFTRIDSYPTLQEKVDQFWESKHPKIQPSSSSLIPPITGITLANKPLSYFTTNTTKSINFKTTTTTTTTTTATTATTTATARI
eukprot:UN03427